MGTKQMRLVSEIASAGFSTGYGRTASVTGGGIGGPLGPIPSPSSTLSTHMHTHTQLMFTALTVQHTTLWSTKSETFIFTITLKNVDFTK